MDGRTNGRRRLLMTDDQRAQDNPTASAPLDELAEQADTGKPPVDVTGELEVNLERVRAELTREDRKPSQPGKIGNEIFRNGQLVRLGRDDDDEPILFPHTYHTLKELLAQRLVF